MYLRCREKLKFLLDRVFFMAVMIILAFIVVVFQFYNIQIIEHDTYVAAVSANVQREVEIEASRGLIYDRYGKPLVQNKTINVIQFDPEIRLPKDVDSNQILVNVAHLLKEEGFNYIDNIPISKTPPFRYTGDETEIQQFITNYVPYDDNKHKLELYKLSAPELIDYLCSDKVYDLAETFSEIEKREILAMRIQISQTQYQKYKKVTLAEDVNMKVVAAIKEHQEAYPAITAEVATQRYYTYGKALGNVIGYMRKITENQYETLKEKGYEKDDIIGQVGVEGEFEETLRGIDGKQLIEVDNVGRTVRKIPLESKNAVVGNDVYLTIDADLQQQVYNALERRLSEGIIERLKGAYKTQPLTAREVIVSMAKNNQIDLECMEEAEASEYEKALYQKVSTSYEKELARLEATQRHLPDEEKMNLTLKRHFANMLEAEQSPITDSELLLVFGIQGTWPFTKQEMERIATGNYYLTDLVIEALESGKIKPDQMDITPCSGSAVVVDSNNGQTLALVSYPSYDSNEFTRNFNKIFNKLNDGVDKRSIEFNRALKTVKAPGSTLKMITGIAGLEEGVVSPNESIYDVGQFTKAGDSLECWIYTNTGHGHGDVDMVRGLEVSCNYYFNEVAYRLGEKFGAPYGGIKVLSSYAQLFGLGEKSGIELEEAEPNISSPTNAVNTQAARFLNILKNMNSERKRSWYQDLEEYAIGEEGFYPLGDSEATSLEGQVDYLSGQYIKSRMDIELSLVLSEEDSLNSILNRLVEGYVEAFDGQVSHYADTLTTAVMEGDTDLSLKYRLKQELGVLLKEKASNKADKAIRRLLASMPEGTMEQIFLEGYKEALQTYQGDVGKEEVCQIFKERINALERGNFACKQMMVDKVLDRIINAYLDSYFKDIQMEWTVMDNISSAIGQGQHTFAPVQMARYIAGLANGKTVYNLTVLSGIYDHKKTNQYIPHEATVFNTLSFKEGTIETIREGMRAVVVGRSGTARTYFEDFDIEIAAKTGTAQESGCENSWITTFAPYDYPEIAVVSSMYGTDGLGSCTYNFVKDVYNIYFNLNQMSEKVSLDNQFIE